MYTNKLPVCHCCLKASLRLVTLRQGAQETRPVAMSQNTCTFQKLRQIKRRVTACSTQSSQKSEHLRRNAQNVTSLILVPEFVINLSVRGVRLATCDVATTTVVFR